MSKTKPDDNKEKALFDAGVKEYSAEGRFYYDIGYKPSETHVLAAFRLTPQEASHLKKPPPQSPRSLLSPHGQPCGPIISWTHRVIPPAPMR